MQTEIKEFMKDDKENRQKLVNELHDSIMTCSREDASVEKVKHKSSLFLKRRAVNHSRGDLPGTHDDTDLNYSPKSSKSQMTSAKKLNNLNSSAPKRPRGRPRTTSLNKGKGQTSPMLTLPGKSSHRPRLSSRSESKQVILSPRTSRQSSRSLTVDLNVSPSNSCDYAFRRSPRKPSLRQVQPKVDSAESSANSDKNMRLRRYSVRLAEL